MKTIFLIGFMGAGKTTVGQELALRMKRKFVDTDKEIIKQVRKEIAEIFAEEGEESFRLLETQLLKKMTPHLNAVVATGGGIILREENRLWMKENGFVFFLDTNPEEIKKRLEFDESRPLLKGDKEKNIKEMMAKRHSFYESTSHYVIDTTGKSPKMVADEIENCL
ncbi:MAG: shikimate kinase [Bacillota bacterium]|nr:shikimate kinase [Bacillota bacterium]